MAGEPDRQSSLHKLACNDAPADEGCREFLAAGHGEGGKLRELKRNSRKSPDRVRENRGYLCRTNRAGADGMKFIERFLQYATAPWVVAYFLLPVNIWSIGMFGLIFTV